MPVKKKNGQIWICVYFCDLNKECPKGAFSLPNTNLLIDIVVGHEMFSIMDGFCDHILFIDKDPLVDSHAIWIKECRGKL